MPSSSGSSGGDDKAAAAAAALAAAYNSLEATMIDYRNQVVKIRDAYEKIGLIINTQAQIEQKRYQMMFQSQTWTRMLTMEFMDFSDMDDNGFIFGDNFLFSEEDLLYLPSSIQSICNYYYKENMDPVKYKFLHQKEKDKKLTIITFKQWFESLEPTSTDPRIEVTINTAREFGERNGLI